MINKQIAELKYHSTHIHKGLLKVGISIYPAETDKCYPLHNETKGDSYGY
jgi:hypothetical protein